jgi:hypothetical protein
MRKSFIFIFVLIVFLTGCGKNIQINSNKNSKYSDVTIDRYKLLIDKRFKYFGGYDIDEGDEKGIQAFAAGDTTYSSNTL